mmetsp:Transcript_14899/g.45542  ORF Transcript_14899/g.45542 Transcript_14899/m.45542 type:complete len:280 (+) Transcript_14899:505-1344(+)|eukprot:scaffold28528_cov24-Tisochrysis_lutea.AAC.3
MAAASCDTGWGSGGGNAPVGDEVAITSTASCCAPPGFGSSVKAPSAIDPPLQLAPRVGSSTGSEASKRQSPVFARSALPHSKAWVSSPYNCVASGSPYTCVSSPIRISANGARAGCPVTPCDMSQALAPAGVCAATHSDAQDPCADAVTVRVAAAVAACGGISGTTPGISSYAWVSSSAAPTRLGSRARAASEVDKTCAVPCSLVRCETSLCASISSLTGCVSTPCAKLCSPMGCVKSKRASICVVSTRGVPDIASCAKNGEAAARSSATCTASSAILA